MGLTVCCLSGRSSAEPLEKREFCIAAGRAQGNYSRMASALKDAIDNLGGDFTLRVESTEGSYSNAALLREGKCDLALMQGDVAYLEHFNGHPFYALCRLYMEPLHIVVRRELRLEHLSQLIPGRERYRVAVGKQGSGTQSQALTVLEELSLPASRLEKDDVSPFSESLTQLRDRNLDIIFLTSAVPVAEIATAVHEKAAALLDIDGDIADQLRAKNPFFLVTEIPYEPYSDEGRNVLTVGTRALLVGRPGVPDPLVRQLLDAVYALPGKQKDLHLPALTDLSVHWGLDDVPIPVHPAAREYHTEKMDPGLRWYRLARPHLPPLLILLLLALFLLRLPKFAYSLHRYVFGRILFLLLVIWLAGAAAMHFIEGKENSNFRSFWNSSIAIIHYLFSGLESKYPTTDTGNVVAILILTLGTAVAAIFTATLVKTLVEKVVSVECLQRKPEPFFKLRGHVVIAGWSQRTERLLMQLRSKDLRRKPPAVVITSNAKETRVARRKDFPNVWVVEGDPSTAKTLLRADLPTAASVVVLADSRSDAPTVATCLTVDGVAPTVHCLAEVGRSDSIEHLAHLHVDEVVNTIELTDKLIAQCLVTPGLAAFYREILTFGKNSQEIRILPIPEDLDGLPFSALRGTLYDGGVIPIGYRRGEDRKIVLNPPTAGGLRTRRLSASMRPGEGDSLIFVADDTRCFRSRRLKRVLKSHHGKDNRRWSMEAQSTVADRVSRHPVQKRHRKVAICGWNDKARQIIEQLEESVVARHCEFTITVVSDPAKASFKNANGVKQHRNVHFVFGDPTKRSFWECSRIDEMDSVVVLAELESPKQRKNADYHTLMVALAATDVNPDVHLVAEVVDSANQEHFEKIRGVEIVSVQDVAEKVLAQAVISPGITGVFQELLTATEDSNEVYIVPVPPRWQGKTFQEAYSLACESGEDVILLGLRSAVADEPVLVINPAKGRRLARDEVNWREHELEESDHLVVLAYEEPAW